MLLYSDNKRIMVNNLWEVEQQQRARAAIEKPNPWTTQASFNIQKKNHVTEPPGFLFLLGLQYRRYVPTYGNSQKKNFLYLLRQMC